MPELKCSVCEKKYHAFDKRSLYCSQKCLEKDQEKRRITVKLSE